MNHVVFLGQVLTYFRQGNEFLYREVINLHDVSFPALQRLLLTLSAVR